MVRPREYDDKLAERLLAEAAALLARHGSDGVSLRAVAVAAGTTTKAIYTLYGGKDELLRAVFERATRTFARAQSPVVDQGDPVAWLEALALGYRSWALANPHLFRLMFTGPAAAAHEAWALRGRSESSAPWPLLDAVRAAQAAGVIGAGHDPFAVAAAFWAHVHGHALLTLNGLLPDEGGEQLLLQGGYALLRGWAS